MAELDIELCAYSTQGRCSLQDAGFCAAIQRRVASSSWLARSVCSLDWGWYPDDRLTDASRAVQKAFQTWEMNCGPLSETMYAGIPWRRKTLDTRSSAVSLAESNLGRAIKWTDLEKWSMMVRMAVFPLEGGKPRCMSDRQPQTSLEHEGQPEGSAEELEGPVYAWMTGKRGAMCQRGATATLVTSMQQQSAFRGGGIF